MTETSSEQKYADMAFETALARGVLAHDEASPNYVGDFMYMGDNNEGAHLFKNRHTRAYLPPVRAARLDEPVGAKLYEEVV